MFEIFQQIFFFNLSYFNIFLLTFLIKIHYLQCFWHPKNVKNTVIILEKNSKIIHYL